MEECSELLDTIDREDIEHMREELGDVLIQVVMHSQLTEEAGHFDLEVVAAEANEKLIRRHPHVFGDRNAENPEEALVHWDSIKATEKKNGVNGGSLFKELPPQLPALLYARKVYRQIEKQDLNTDGIFDNSKLKALSSKIDENSVGATLFEIAAACRLAGIDPEAALRRYTTSVTAQLKDASDTG